MRAAVLSSPTWKPLTEANALARLKATGREVSDARMPLVGYVVKEANDAVAAWLENRGLALGLTRYEALMGSEGTLELVPPYLPIQATDLEVIHEGEPLEGVKVINSSRLFRPEGFPSTVQVETSGRFGTYAFAGPALPEITVRVWAGYAEGEIPAELDRAIWVTFKTWFDRDLREGDLAYELRLKTASSYRKPSAIPDDARQILLEYAESFDG